MKNSKLIEMLQTFNKEEFRLLGKYIESPYFGGRRDCSPLYNSLKKYYPKFDEDDVQKKKLFNEIFPGRKHTGKTSDTLLLTMASDMYKLCREFLVYIELNEERIQKEHMLLRQLNKRKLYKEFNRQYEKISSSRHFEGLNKNDRLNNDDLQRNAELIAIYGANKKQQGDIKGVIGSFKYNSDNSLAYAVINACRFIGVKYVGFSFNIDVGYNFSESLMSALDTKAMLDLMEKENDPLYPYIAANIMVYNMTLHAEENIHYENLKHILNTYDRVFGLNDKYILHNILATYIINKDNRHHTTQLTMELFNLYKLAYERGVYKAPSDKSLEPTNYRNMLSAAFEVGELQWAEDFINKTSGELPPEFAEGMKDYSYANLYFIKGEYSRALTHIVRIKYDYFLHKQDAKVLQFKIYYELGNYEQCYSVIDTTRHYLASTNDLGEVFVERYTNFIKYASELVKRKSSNNNIDAGFTLAKLRGEKAVESKNWLINKIGLLDKS